MTDNNQKIITVKIDNTEMTLYKNIDYIKQILNDNDEIAKLNIHPIVKNMLLSTDKNTLMKNADRHFNKISTHCRYVSEFCDKAGISERGRMHDASKFSADELFESILFFEGYRSPIEKANEVLGWSPAFVHHVKTNDHHLEHSVYSINGTTIPAPKDFLSSVECVCDFCGASMTYAGEDKFSMADELKWWQGRLNNVLTIGLNIHNDTARFITIALEKCAENEKMIDYNEFVDVWNSIYADKTYMHKQYI